MVERLVWQTEERLMVLTEDWALGHGETAGHLLSGHTLSAPHQATPQRLSVHVGNCICFTGWTLTKQSPSPQNFKFSCKLIH